MLVRSVYSLEDASSPTTGSSFDVSHAGVHALASGPNVGSASSTQQADLMVGMPIVKQASDASKSESSVSSHIMTMLKPARQASPKAWEALVSKFSTKAGATATPSSLFEGSTTNISHLSADERQRRRKGSLLSGDTVDDLTAAKERPTRC